jgi:hypothetical protein
MRKLTLVGADNFDLNGQKLLSCVSFDTAAVAAPCDHWIEQDGEFHGERSI